MNLDDLEPLSGECQNFPDCDGVAAIRRDRHDVVVVGRLTDLAVRPGEGALRISVDVLLAAANELRRRGA